MSTIARPSQIYPNWDFLGLKMYHLATLIFIPEDFFVREKVNPVFEKFCDLTLQRKFHYVGPLRMIDLLARVARWYIFVPKSTNFVVFLKAVTLFMTGSD
jgi:hypothetical protein